MRTTIVIDPEVAQQVRAVMAESRQSLRKVVNDLLRKGLAGSKGPGTQTVYAVCPFESGAPGGLISGRFNQTYDEMESDRFMGEAAGEIHESASGYHKGGK